MGPQGGESAQSTTALRCPPGEEKCESAGLICLCLFKASRATRIFRQNRCERLQNRPQKNNQRSFQQPAEVHCGSTEGFRHGAEEKLRALQRRTHPCKYAGPRRTRPASGFSVQAEAFPQSWMCCFRRCCVVLRCCSAGVGDTPGAAICCGWPVSRTTSTTRKTTSGGRARAPLHLAFSACVEPR